MLTTDYLIIGSGAVGMIFADQLLTETDANVVIVDRHHIRAVIGMTPTRLLACINHLRSMAWGLVNWAATTLTSFWSEQKRICDPRRSMSAHRGEADVTRTSLDVRW